MGSSEPDEDMASTETEQCREGRGIYSQGMGRNPPGQGTSTSRMSGHNQNPMALRLGTPSRMWVRLLNTESGRTTNLCPVVHA